MGLVMTRMVWLMLCSKRVNNPVEEGLLKKVLSTPVEGDKNPAVTLGGLCGAQLDLRMRYMLSLSLE